MAVCTACRARPAVPNALQCHECQRGQREGAIARVRAVAEDASATINAPPPVARVGAKEKANASRVATVLNLLGFVVENTSQPRASGISEGVPDKYVRCPVRKVRFWVEDKRLTWGAPRKDGTQGVRRTKPSKVQEAWIAVEEASGGCVIVAACVSDLLMGFHRAGIYLTGEELAKVEPFRAGDPPGYDWHTPISYADAVRVLREERRKMRTRK
jgi:hypothetical protein